MLKIKLFGLLGAIALIAMATACTPQSPTPDPESDTGAESVAPDLETAEGRAAYSEVPLPPAEQLVGTDPEAIALAAFGMADPGEGNFAQEVTVDEQTATDAVVTLTQTGLLDDSVEGMRYRLEFTAADNQWEMMWAGRQVRCQPNRGSQEWATDLCS
ncbi:hypothetical protein [Halomicronema sp. CCY15110]|uniref:hypothetical protein n=1 Tax=Halomicronema sp. CCY15110 TaxID=2767773 RepID=UPI0019504E93|nr:hypothetical protein [Halomicronema sp. CCY15110]